MRLRKINLTVFAIPILSMNNKCTLFLGDLSAFVAEQDIHNVFGPYGEIVEIKIMRSEETMRNLSYGFIKFSHSNSAKRAMNNLDGVLFCGRHLRVGWASYKNRKEPKLLQHHDRIESSSVHVSYISYQLKRLITEESLRILFSSFGMVLDTSIKKTYIDESINRQCGYGFVHFASSPAGIQSALSAVSGLNDATIEEVCYKCSISHNLEKQLLVMQTPSFDRSTYLEQTFPFSRMSGSSVSSVESNSSTYNSSSANIQRNYGPVRSTANRSSIENQFRLATGEMYYSTEDVNANIYPLSHNGSFFSPTTSREASMGYGQEVCSPTLSSDMSFREFTTFTNSLPENVPLFKPHDRISISSSNLLQTANADVQFKFQSNREFQLPKSMRGMQLNEIDSSISSGLPESCSSICSSSSMYSDLTRNIESHSHYDTINQPLHLMQLTDPIPASVPQQFSKGQTFEQSAFANCFDVTTVTVKSSIEDSMEHRMAISLPRGTSLPQNDDADGIFCVEKTTSTHGNYLETSNNSDISTNIMASEQSCSNTQPITYFE